MKITRPTRTFLPEKLIIEKWEDIERYCEDLLTRNIDEKAAYEKWLADKSELDAVLEEDAAWRYIRMTINTKDQSLTEHYTFFVTQIQPKLAPYEDKLNKKLVESPWFAELDRDEAYHIYFRSVKTALKLYREENVAIESEIGELSQKFGAITGAQSIEHDGKQITMQKASTFLRETDESLRKEVFEKMAERRTQDVEALDKLYSDLIAKRTQIAKNAGYENFRDYKFDALGRFDYTKEDCFDFHRAVKKEIVPLVRTIQQERLKKFGKEKFKPWDGEVDPEGKKPLQPFDTARELIDGTVHIFKKLDPYFADCLQTMDEMEHLDLESKDGKAPGGYNYPLYEIGVPFIFMNAVGAQRDLTTMVHEGGHAIHSFLSRDLAITSFKSLPSEVAELASMSMELLTMDYWDEFYDDADNLQRAKREQLESILKILPWIAQIDEFQHWVYENYDHSPEERYAQWEKLNREYGSGLTDWSGYEDVRKTSWQRQMHLFEVPFYYIEYGIAQLGALGVWKNSKDDQHKAIEAYKNALKLGYTRSIPEIYNTAGVDFKFDSAHLKTLATFVGEELEQLHR